MPTNKLTHLQATNLVKAGKKARTGDGGGLWLDVRGPGRAAWVFRYTRQGKAHEVGLGSFDLVSLAAARQAAIKCQTLIAQGQDPLLCREAEKRAEIEAEQAAQAAANAVKITFKFAAEARIAAKEAEYGVRSPAMLSP